MPYSLMSLFSSSLHENSFVMLFGDSSAAILYASVMFAMVTDFEPYSFLIQLELGRLIPIGVAGKQSPPMHATFITFAVTPFTSFFLNSFFTGELSSNHCALSLISCVLLEAAISLKFTEDSHVALRPRGSL